MEPIKGGGLANPVEKIQKMFHEYNPTASAASWAIRYAASLEGVLVVLSGMSKMEHASIIALHEKSFNL
jgi:predicted aldo/keto reductase-like oxidoreductase